MRTPASRILPLLLLLLLASMAGAQEKSPWVGVRVVTKFSKPLREDGQVVEGSDRSHVYDVDRAEGGLLHLTTPTVRGWIESADVVPFAKAVAFYDLAVRRDPDDPAAYRGRGWIRFHRKEADEALADFSIALGLDPGDAASHFGRAQAHYLKREDEQAIAGYSEALRLEPGLWYVREMKAAVHVRRREWDQSIADYDEVLRARPGHALGYSGRAVAWIGKAEYDRAIADCDRAIRPGKGASTHTELGRAHLHRGLAWQLKEDYPRAKVDYQDAVRLAPRVAVGIQALASLLATCPDGTIRDGKQAVELATKGCELTSGKDPLMLDALAAAHAEVGDFDQAVTCQERAIARTPPGGSGREAREERLGLYRSRMPFHDPGP